MRVVPLPRIADSERATSTKPRKIRCASDRARFPFRRFESPPHSLRFDRGRAHPVAVHFACAEKMREMSLEGKASAVERLARKASAEERLALKEAEAIAERAFGFALEVREQGRLRVRLVLRAFEEKEPFEERETARLRPSFEKKAEKQKRSSMPK